MSVRNFASIVVYNDPLPQEKFQAIVKWLTAVQWCIRFNNKGVVKKTPTQIFLHIVIRVVCKSSNLVAILIRDRNDNWRVSSTGAYYFPVFLTLTGNY